MEIINVSKRYGNSRYALENATFTLHPGVTGLIGRNGSGKTTLMKIICEIIQRHKGEVKKDADVTIGYLIEDPKYYKHKTGWYNIKYFGEVFGTHYDKEYVDYIVDKLGMRDYLKRKVKTYSLGMKQKLGLVLSLLNRPKYLVLDEPTNGMDPDGSIDVLNIIKEFSEQFNMDVLISSHKLEDIEMISDHILFVEKGILSEQVTLENLHEDTMVELVFDSTDVKLAKSILAKVLGDKLESKGNSIFFPHNGDMSFVLEQLGKEDIYPKDVLQTKQSLKDYYFQMIEGAKV